jgi:hypothetical protein
MATYRFIGDVALFHTLGKDLHLTQFGQSVELSASQAEIGLSQRVPFLTEAEYQKLPTAEPARHAKAAELFVNKLVEFYQKQSGVVVQDEQLPTDSTQGEQAPEETK